MELGEQIRQWLVAHEARIDFSEKGFITRRIKATPKEWEELYRLLGLEGISNGSRNG